MAEHVDIAIAGGGLAGSLIALALAARRPDLTLRIVEKGGKIGGNHVWSFFESDVAEADRALVEPLICARWDTGYTVRFPAYERHLRTPYRSITSDNLARTLARALPAEAIVTGRPITKIDPAGLTLAGGQRIEAGGVIDARGLSPGLLRRFDGGWQKFVGHWLKTSAPHGLREPIVMDAAVTQADGYRFVYCLPFASDEVFVEDTYYSDTPDIDSAALDARIADYAAAHGWQVSEVLRRESGVLPVVTGGDFDAFWQAGTTDVGRAGVRAALFQPLTSYSFPDALRMASAIAALPDLGSASLARFSYRHARHHWRRGRFFRLLSRMLFGASEPLERYKVLQRFYGLDETLIERFYAGESTHADKLRVLAGKPPVPIGRAALTLAGIGAPGPLGLKGGPPPWKDKDD